MSTWDERRMTCMHNVREGLDSHECPDCADIARSQGKTVVPGRDTWIYFSDPRKKKAKAGKK